MATVSPWQPYINVEGVVQQLAVHFEQQLSDDPHTVEGEQMLGPEEANRPSQQIPSSHSHSTVTAQSQHSHSTVTAHRTIRFQAVNDEHGGMR